jgi:hypothetical protein
VIVFDFVATHRQKLFVRLFEKVIEATVRMESGRMGDKTEL